MSANDILASGKPFNVVFKATFDVQTVLGLQYQEDLIEILGQPSDVVEVDDSTVYLSMSPVIGLSCIESILERPFTEEYLSEPFGGGIDYALTALKVHIDSNLLISNQSLQNRAYELYIGYIDDTWTDYALWLTGKTLGGVRNGSELRLDLTTSTTYNKELFPLNTYTNGVCIPYIHGTVYDIKPTLRPQGDYQFHDGAIDVAAGSYKSISPSIHMSSVDADYLGDYKFLLVDTSFNEVESTATDALPSDIDDTFGKIEVVSDYIQVTIPDSSNDGAGVAPFKEFAKVIIYPKVVSGGSLESNITYYDEWTLRLNESSTVEDHNVQAGGSFGEVIPLKKNVITTFKTQAIADSLSSRAEMFFKKADADDAEVVIVDLIGMRRTFVAGDTQDVQVYDSSGEKYPTRRIGDVDSTTEVEGVALYDDNGLLRVPNDLTEFTIDAVGQSSSRRSVSACHETAISATSSAVSVSASFIGEPIGYFANKQLPWVQHMREMLKYSDYVIKQNLTDDNIVLERRYNYQPRDFDNADNDVNQFVIYSDDVDPSTINQGVIKTGASRYNVRYQLKQNSPEKSKVATDFNSQGILTQVDTYDSYFQSEVNALEIASLVSRGANECLPVTLQVFGQGLGLETNMTGRIERDDIRSGIAHIRKVREVGKNTELQVDIYV